MTKQREGAAITPPEAPGQWDGVGWNWKHVHPTRGERLDEAIALTKALLNRLAVLRKILEAAGVDVDRAYTPNHKLIERFFGSLWTKLSFLDGQIGRYRGEMERENKLLMSAQAGRLDPREHFPLLEKAMDAIEAAIAMQNAEPVESRQYGTWVPQERWEDDLADQPRPTLTDDLGWMWAPDVKEWTVRTNGMVGGMVPSVLG